MAYEQPPSRLTGGKDARIWRWTAGGDAQQQARLNARFNVGALGSGEGQYWELEKMPRFSL